MNNKFFREARECARLFGLEYWIDVDIARSNLKERLEGKRARVKDLTKSLIADKFPEVDLDD